MVDFLIFVMVYKSLTAMLHLWEFHRKHFHVEPFIKTKKACFDVSSSFIYLISYRDKQQMEAADILSRYQLPIFGL